MNYIGTILACSAAILSITSCQKGPELKPWQTEVRRDLKKLGARNWIIIAEPGFPMYSGKGTQVISSDESIPELTTYVLNTLEEYQQVQPRIYTAQEMAVVKEDFAPGISQLRSQIKSILLGRNHSDMQNATLMQLMQDASQSYNVLVIKSQTALPYSNVFMELDSGYWDSESETALRKQVESNKPQKQEF